MKAYYDKEVDALGISRENSNFLNTYELCQGVYIDLDENGKPIGVEILNLHDFMKNNVYNVKLNMKIETSFKRTPKDIKKEIKPILTKIKDVTGYDLKIESVSLVEDLEGFDTNE